ncbi:unnamed protein product [Blepharisma stoltei]|uniref:Uncharacterized protein n=1 Tax=Blepharisma stoltei TaxID=1481888 RepID=A0AAU9IAJ3_9CILI|nr:unnamed protein product [Blepharisma stoltei]
MESSLASAHSTNTSFKRPKPTILKRVDPLKRVPAQESLPEKKKRFKLSITFQDEIEKSLIDQLESTKVTSQTPISETTLINLNKNESFISSTNVPSPKIRPKSARRLKTTSKEKELRIPITVLSNHKYLKESTKNRLVYMVAEALHFSPISIGKRSVSVPKGKSSQNEYNIPAVESELDVALRQIKEKERILRQESHFGSKVRNLQMKIEKRIYRNEIVEHKPKKRIFRVKRNPPFVLSEAGRTLDYKSCNILPSGILIEPTFI